MDIPNYVVIPFRGHHKMTLALANELRGQGADVILVDNDPGDSFPYDDHFYLQAKDQNLTEMWNRAYMWADQIEEDNFDESQHKDLPSPPPFNVTFLNNDIAVPPNFLKAMSEVLRSHERWWVVSPDHPKAVAVRTMEPAEDSKYCVREVADVGYPRPGCTEGGMCGWAFMVRGENTLFPLDPQFQWWCGDNEIIMSTRIQGGSVGLIEGLYVEHETSTTLNERMDELAPILNDDIQRFRNKYSSASV